MKILLNYLSIKPAPSGTNIIQYPVLLTVDYPFNATTTSLH